MYLYLSVYVGVRERQKPFKQNLSSQREKLHAADWISNHTAPRCDICCYFKERERQREREAKERTKEPRNKKNKYERGRGCSGYPCFKEGIGMEE